MQKGLNAKPRTQMNFQSGNDAKFGREAVAGSRDSRRAGPFAHLERAGSSLHWDEKHEKSTRQPGPSSQGTFRQGEVLENGSLKEKFWRSLRQQEGSTSRQDCPAEEERERAQGWCRGLSAQRSRAKLLLWNKICWNVDTPIPE